MAQKMTARKELRQPDALQRAGTDARDWLKERERAVGIAVIVVLLVGLAAALASYFSQRGEEKASRQLGAALAPLERPVREGPAPANALETPESPFASQKAKDEAVIKSLSDFRAAHSGTDAAATAALPLGQAQLRLGQSDAALASFDEYLKKAPAKLATRAQALEGKGYALEAKGDLEGALGVYDQLAKESSSEFLAGMGSYHRARILVAQGKKDEAAKLLTEIERDHPDSAASRMSRERLTLLAAEGVAIPTASPAAGVDAGG